MPVQYFGFCPKGDECSKKHARLGNDATEEAARERIYNHLTTSTYHVGIVSDEEARMLADGADVQFEDYEEQPAWTPEPKWGQQTWQGGDWDNKRSAPYPQGGGKGGKGRGGGAGKLSNEALMQVAGVVQDTVNAALEPMAAAAAAAAAASSMSQQQLPHQIMRFSEAPSSDKRTCDAARRCLEAAKAASKISRQCALAFDEDPCTLR